MSKQRALGDEERRAWLRLARSETHRARHIRRADGAVS
jgi:hypothetical protein